MPHAKHLAPSLRLSLLPIALMSLLLMSETGRSQSTDFDVSTLEEALQFRCIGPFRGGRSAAVTGVPGDPMTFYMGATGGGVWKTDDYGTTWYPISDGYIQTGSIGAIRVAPSDSDVVYVGTGSDGIRSNVITGRGLYRSDDAGRSWELMGLDPDSIFAHSDLLIVS